ncbi:MAG: indolepyruvate oxidoreductase subunit beta [Kiritimatiellaeota bacterium]|nr:indolepyruvate oxidoreductase subunit beta [Kiritimatiellota bacterium]
MSDVFNVSLVGVGGQGILLTSEVLARAAANAGFDVKKSEIHGMAQRGGSVISQVRFGGRVFSPIIPDGASRVLVSFEKLEALRWRHLLAPDGVALVNDLEITPVTVSSGQQPAVADQETKLREAYPKLFLLDAQALAKEAGNPRTANMALAGALSALLPFDVSCWRAAMRERIPEKLLTINEKAFDLGRGAIH